VLAKAHGCSQAAELISLNGTVGHAVAAVDSGKAAALVTWGHCRMLQLLYVCLACFLQSASTLFLPTFVQGSCSWWWFWLNISAKAMHARMHSLGSTCDMLPSP
jgi:hypothetical protein